MAGSYDPRFALNQGRPGSLPEEDEDELYSGYNDTQDDDVLYGNLAPAGGAEPGYDEGGAFYDDRSSYSSSQGFGVAAMRAPGTARAGGRPIGTAAGGRAPGTAMMRAPTTASTGELQRPMTSVKGAGYSSQPRTLNGKFDPLNQAARGPAPPLQKKSEATPEEACRELERKVNVLYEESSEAQVKGELALALEKAKEAGKRERQLCKQREQAGLAEQNNVDLTYAVAFNLANQYHLNGLYTEALNTFTQIVKSKQFSQAGRLRVNMGNIYYEQKKYPQAIKMYRMALDQIPNTARELRYKIMRNIGNAFMRLGQYQDAVQSYEAIMDGVPESQAGFNLVVCYYALGDRERMKKSFTRLLGVHKFETEGEDDMDTQQDSVLEDDGLREELKARQKAALQYISTAARLIAPNVGASFVEGYEWVVEALSAAQLTTLAHEMEMAKAIQHLQRRDFAQAITVLKEFERKELGLKARAATNLSFLYFLEGDLPNADKYAELAVKSDRYNARGLVNKGNCLFMQGDMEGARALYTEAVGVEADCVEAMYNLGLAHNRLGSKQEALTIFKKVNTLLPDNVEVIFQIGSVFEASGNLKQAMKWYEILNTRVMNDPGILARLGSIHSKYDDEAKALHYYSESHRVYPVDMDVISWLGAFHVKSEVYEKAMPFFDLASRIQPNEVKWHLMVASCYRRIAAYPQALAKYKEIHKAHPENIECLRYLVHICTDLSRKDEVHDYVVKLRKAERALAQQQDQQRQQASPLEGMSAPQSRVASAGLRPPSGRVSNGHQRDGEYGFGQGGGSMGDEGFSSESQLGGSQGGFGMAQPLSPASPLPNRTPARTVKMGKKEKSEEDQWGNEELGDDLLPM